MATRGTLFQTPTVEIDQSRYEKLIKNEQKYEQYKEAVDPQIREIIEATPIKLETSVNEEKESEGK